MHLSKILYLINKLKFLDLIFLFSFLTKYILKLLCKFNNNVM